MNVVLDDKIKPSKRQWIAYSIIGIICALALIVAFYFQFYGRVNIFKAKQNESFGKKKDEDIEELSAKFEQIFTNEFKNEEMEYNNKKEKADKELVYTKYNQQENKANSYNIDVVIPYINVKGEVARGI